MLAVLKNLYQRLNRYLVVLFLGGLPTLAFAEMQLYYVHNDHLNTPQFLTDENQTVVWAVESQTPFGEVEVNADPDGNGEVLAFHLRFPGQYFDVETGLSYNYFRDYDPSLGRYIQSDPIGLADGPNTYGYAQQNPLKFIDPLGLNSLAACSNPANAAQCAAAGIGAGSRAGSAGRAGTAGAKQCLVKSEPEPEKPKSCSSEYPGYVSCSEVSHYRYGSKREALWAMGLAGTGRFQNESPIRGGACADTDGAGSHWNVLVGGQRGGSVASCTCCDDSSGTPVLKTKFAAF